MNRAPCSIVVMGVSGAGKTTLGRLLAAALSAPFIDADDYHPQSNVEKMRSGHALSDDDRAPWLELLARLLRRAPEPMVLACSALRQSYRSALGIDDEQIRLVYLRLPRQALETRLDGRVGHFAGPTLLDGQLLTLEEPTTGLVLDGDLPLPRLVQLVLDWLAVP